MSEVTSTWIPFLGRFHPVLVHLPIGILVFAAFLHILNNIGKALKYNELLKPLYLWGGISALISCLAGFALHLDGGYDETTVDWHQNLGIATAGIAFIAWVYVQNHGLFGKIIPYTIMVLLLVTGHLGGNLTHGSDYLTAKTPEPFRSWLGIAAASTTVAAPVEKKPIDTTSAIVYKDIIKPILDEKCVQCHNNQKQKGKLRLDTPEFMAKGGEEGPIFVAGNADASEMIKRALLPTSNDKHMPPKDKTQLTENELALLHWWISKGASFDSKLAETETDDKIKPIIVSLTKIGTGKNSTKVSESAVYDFKIEAASAKDMASLTSKNILVLPIAKSMNFLEVNTINNKEFGDAEAALLEPLANQIVWLKAPNTKITDKGMPSMAKLKNLIKLNLNHTAVGDMGIKSLAQLQYIEVLNLVNTQVTDASLSEIAKMKSLKKVYLWQSKCTKAGIENLKRQRPDLYINFGWEGKIFQSDSLAKYTAAKQS